MPCGVPAGPTMNPSGQDLALALPSAKREKGKPALLVEAAIISAILEKPDISSASLAAVIATPTIATFGRKPAVLSATENLQFLLENRLRVRMAEFGSPLYRLTCKQWDMPLRGPIFALRALAARTSDSGNTSSGWPTPRISGAGESAESWAKRKAAEYEKYPGKGIGGLSLDQAAASLAGWPTTTTRDHKDGDCEGTVPVNALLGRAVWLSGWPTTTTADSRRQPSPGFTTPNISLNHAATMVSTKQPMRLCADGTLLTGFSAGMAGGGRLNPSHSRWLMRLPRAWDDCVPMEMPSTRKQRRNSVAPSVKSLEYDL
jgi:hypothetical protein